MLADTKRPQHKLDDDSLFTYREIKDHPDVATLIEEPFVVIDVDDGDHAQRLYDLIESEDIACWVMKTTRGMHFWFKTDTPLKNSVGANTPLTIKADYRSWGLKPDGTPKKSYVKIKDSGEWRQWLRRCTIEDMSSIPYYLLPLHSKYEFSGLGDGDGRNQLMYEYILTLQKNQYTKEMIHETLSYINSYIFDTPLDREELNVILRDESFVQDISVLGTAPVFNPHESSLGDAPWLDDKQRLRHEILAHYIIQDLLLVTYNDVIYLYENGYYQPAFNLIKRRMIDLYPQITKNQRTEVLDYIMIVSQIDRPHSEEYVINVNNGRLDLRTGQLYEHNPDIYDFVRVPITYDPNAYDSTTDSLINRVFVNDVDLVHLFQEMIGYTLCKNSRLHKSFFLLGEGSNGKSTVLEMLKQMLGPDNVSNLSLTDMEHNFKPAELLHKLANIGDDISAIAIKDTGLFKKLSSGDTITVDRKYQLPLKLNNYATLWFSTNKMPTFADKSDGMRRRMVILPFDARFSSTDDDFDPDIIDKVTTETAKAYLLNVAIQGLKRLRTNDQFTLPLRVVKALERDEIESSSVLTWLYDEGIDQEYCIGKEKTVLYEQYRMWCRDDNALKPMKKMTVYKVLEQQFDLEERQIRLDNGTRPRVYVARGDTTE